MFQIHGVRSDADGFVPAYAAVPHEFCHDGGDEDPSGLDQDPLVEGGLVETFEEYGDGEIELVREDRIFGERSKGCGEEVEGEHVAAEEVFERVEKEDDGGDFEEPEREHGQRVGDEELDERCHCG